MYTEIDRVESAHNRVVVRRRGQWVDLDVAGATFASYHAERMLTGYSWDAIAAGALLGRPRPRSVLLLGLGAGTCLRPLRHLDPDARLVGVELDPTVVDLSRRHLGLSDVDVETHIADADGFLARTRERFDVVIDDLFLSGTDDVARSGDPGEARIRRLARRLTADGVLVANFITDVDHRAVYRRGRDAFRTVFPSVAVVRPPLGLNAIVVGGRAVAGRPRLLEHTARFATARDRDLWAQLSVRRLPAR